MYKKIALGLLVGALMVTVGCGGDDKKPAEKKDPKPAATQAPAKKEYKKLYTDEELKKMTPAQRAEARKKEYRANLSPEELRAVIITDRPEHQQYVKMVGEKYPHLKHGSVGYRFEKMVIPGEVIYGYHRVLPSANAPKFKIENGMEIKGTENYDIEVLYGACKGQCVIEATETHTVKLTAEQRKNPLIEKKTLVPFDKTYVRHDENGKKWVTHEKCGTK